MTRVLLAGDAHGNQGWWATTVATAVAAVQPDLVLQLGDFGYYPHAQTFIDFVARTDAPVWFLDGNHEHHERLTQDVAVARQRGHIDDPTAPVPLGGALSYLPRGARFTLDGVRFAVMGGAHSIDRAGRLAGVTWFDAEHISEADLVTLADGGPADVLVTHDTVSGYAIPGLRADDDLPAAWRPELAACQHHRMAVRAALESTQPRLLIHGHFHHRYTSTLTEPWGDVTVEGLSCDGNPGALAVLDVPSLVVAPVGPASAPSEDA